MKTETKSMTLEKIFGHKRTRSLGDLIGFRNEEIPYVADDPVFENLYIPSNPVGPGKFVPDEESVQKPANPRLAEARDMAQFLAGDSDYVFQRNAVKSGSGCEWYDITDGFGRGAIVRATVRVIERESGSRYAVIDTSDKKMMPHAHRLAMEQYLDCERIALTGPHVPGYLKILKPGKEED